MRGRLVFTFVLFVVLINLAFCQSNAFYNNVNIHLYLRPDGRMFDGKYLYRISANLLTVPFDSLGTESRLYSNLQIIINGKSFFFADINHILKNEYMGRLREEPYILLKEKEVLTIQVVDTEKKTSTVSLVVPGAMGKVKISPEFDATKINTIDRFVITWEDIKTDKYTWFFYYDSRGEGNSIEVTNLTFGPELLKSDGKVRENIGFEINALNETVITVGIIDILVAVHGPKAWKISNFYMRY